MMIVSFLWFFVMFQKLWSTPIISMSYRYWFCTIKSSLIYSTIDTIDNLEFEVVEVELLTIFITI
jgi:hypothetical protein